MLPGAAHAAVECPSSSGGHRLARMGGASLYQGDPAARMDLAPDRQAADMRGSNVWMTPNPGELTLVCRYDGSQSPVVLRLPPGIRSCTQNLAARTFTCN